jgi:hypothetical protein
MHNTSWSTELQIPTNDGEWMRTLVTMSWDLAFDQLDRTVASRAELLSVGATPASLTAAVRHGHLLRLRRDHYALSSTPVSIQQAVRVGGRLTCTSALQHYGVFAFDVAVTAVHVRRDMSRLRHPRFRQRPLPHDHRDGVELRWRALADDGGGSEVAVGIVDALVCALRCQHPWHAVASLDNALFSGLIDSTGVDEVFRHLPQSLQYMRHLLDGRAESGQESVLRMIVREAGLAYELQVSFAGIGRVDMIVEERLVLEADSRLAHDGWEKQVRDRTRDLALARLQLMSLRPLYQHIMFTPEEVRDAILGLLRA